MTYTPVELRHVRVGRSLFGYNRGMVEEVIAEVAESFEATWRERGELAERVETLEKDLEELRKREDLLTQTLIAAERTSSEIRDRARHDAESIISEAQNEARSIVRAGRSEREQLLSESRRIEAMLRAALTILGEREETPVEPTTAAVKTEPATVVDAPAPTAPALNGVQATPAPEPPAPQAPAAAPAPAQAVPMEPAAPRAPVQPVQAVPAPVEPVPAAEAESGFGWTREDTREFEPIAPLHLAEPVLQRLPGSESHDFDWGE